MSHSEGLNLDRRDLLRRLLATGGLLSAAPHLLWADEPEELPPAKFRDFIDAKDKDGDTALMLASMAGFDNIADLLREYGAKDVSSKKKESKKRAKSLLQQSK